MRKYTAAVATAGVLLLAATGCSSGNPSGSTQTKTLSLPQVAAPQSFAPGASAIGPGDQYLQPVYDSLLRLNEKGEPGPNVATEWSYDSNQTTLSLTLHSDIKFSDGASLDAEAVKAGIAAAKKGGGGSADQLQFIDRVEVEDPTHVKLVLTAPDPSLLINLSGIAGMIASPKVDGQESLKTDPVGSGPYVLDKAQTQPGTKYVYTRNNGYWGDKKTFPYDTINITVFNDKNAMLNAFRSGQIDATTVQDKDAASIKSAGFTVNTSPNYTATGLYLFDREGKLAPALADVRVRQAINYALDRESILKQVYSGSGDSTAQMFSKDSPSYVPELDDRYPYDVAKAKQLMAEAGYADGFSLKMPDVSPIFPAAQAAATEALRAIGITAVYEPVNGQTFISDLIAGKYPAAVFGINNFTPWDVAQQSMVPGGLWNPLHVSDPTVVSLVNEAQKATGDQQVEAFKKLNKYMVEQAWFAPWVQPNQLLAVSKGVTAKPQKYAVLPPIWNYSPTS